jgi:hypothetical protein
MPHCSECGEAATHFSPDCEHFACAQQAKTGICGNYGPSARLEALNDNEQPPAQILERLIRDNNLGESWLRLMDESFAFRYERSIAEAIFVSTWQARGYTVRYDFDGGGWQVSTIESIRFDVRGFSAIRIVGEDNTTDWPIEIDNTQPLAAQAKAFAAALPRLMLRWVY